MKKTPRPEAVIRHARLFGAGNIQVAQEIVEEAKKDAMMKGFIRNFRALYADDGAKDMAKARERAARVNLD